MQNIQETRMSLYRFKNNYEEYDVLKFICPRVQKYCKQILDDLPECVEQIIVFGSSITPGCTSKSDLDLIIIVDKKENKKEVGKALRVLEIEIDAIILTLEEEEEFWENNRFLLRSIKLRSVELYNRKE